MRLLEAGAAYVFSRRRAQTRASYYARYLYSMLGQRSLLLAGVSSETAAAVCALHRAGLDFQLVCAAVQLTALVVCALHRTGIELFLRVVR